MRLQADFQGILATSLRRDKLLVALPLGAVILLSWLYVVTGAGLGMDPAAMSEPAFPPPKTTPVHPPMGWGAGYSLVIFVMWWLMMVAMMLPSAVPVVLIYDRMRRIGSSSPSPTTRMGSSWRFVAGYLLVWGGFSLLATVLQAVFERAGLVHPMTMWSLNNTFTAILLVLAGLYQWTPLKEKCLQTCRSPGAFLARNWRRGQWGALRMGLHHGAYCLGCCWFLMGLLFAGGVMNLYWITGLAIFVLIEKVLPAGAGFGRLAGIGMVYGGIWLLV